MFFMTRSLRVSMNARHNMASICSICSEDKTENWGHTVVTNSQGPIFMELSKESDVFRNALTPRLEFQPR